MLDESLLTSIRSSSTTTPAEREKPEREKGRVKIHAINSNFRQST
jgi:hypothetical protein